MKKKPDMVFLDAETVGEVARMDVLRELGNLTLYQVTRKEDRISHIAGHEIVITNKVIIDREVMDACPFLRLICIAATGMNNVDLEAAAEKGITVKNVSGYSTESVVQHTFALLFHLMNRLEYYSRYVRTGAYANSSLFTHHGSPFSELAGKTFGIIGLGAIGRRVAEVARAFGAHVVYHSTSGKNLDQPYPHLALEELLSSADVVSVHCPLNENTRNLLDAGRLSLMKKNAILINAGRGGIVDEAALADALDGDKLGGAGLDVLSKEPPDGDNPLLNIKNKEKLIITPHVAWAARESRSRLIEGIASNIEDYLKTCR